MYYMGIIDILERWRVKKQSEHYFKAICRCLWRDRMLMSAVHHKPYAERFIRSMAFHLGIALEHVDISSPNPVVLAAEQPGDWETMYHLNKELM